MFKDEAFAGVKTEGNNLIIENLHGDTLYNVHDMFGKSIHSSYLKETDSVVLGVNQGVYLISLWNNNRNQQYKVIVL
jgi:hypothetical protein